MYNSTHECEACVLVNDKPITEVVHNGRTFIEGRRNSNYELYFRNNSSSRVLVIPSVDGLSVVDGKPCGVQSSGYVIDAWSSVTIPGWKVDGETAAKFNFKPQRHGQTYAEASGQDGSNQGVVGFMVFKEQAVSIFITTPWKPDPYPWVKPYEPFNPWRPYWTTTGGTFGAVGTFGAGGTAGDTAAGYSRGGSTAAAPASYTYTADVAKGIAPSSDVQCNVNVCSTPPEESLGTGFGKPTDFSTYEVTFNRADQNNPDAIFSFHYDTVKNLRKMGVPVEQFSRHYSEPNYGANPFPSSPHVSAPGCRPPAGWGKKKSRR